MIFWKNLLNYNLTLVFLKTFHFFVVIKKELTEIKTEAPPLEWANLVRSSILHNMRPLIGQNGYT